MGEAAAWESVTVAGRAERARVARTFVGAVLGPAHPCAEVAVLLAGELFGNSVRHSGSGAPGGTVTVAVRAGDGVVQVEVTDRSGPGVPRLRPADRDAEGGRGLRLVAGLAARWGWRRRGGRPHSTEGDDGRYATALAFFYGRHRCSPDVSTLVLSAVACGFSFREPRKGPIPG